MSFNCIAIHADYTYTVVVTTSDSQNDVLSADAVISLEINAGNTLTGGLTIAFKGII